MELFVDMTRHGFNVAAAQCIPVGKGRQAKIACDFWVRRFQGESILTAFEQFLQSGLCIGCSRRDFVTISLIEATFNAKRGFRQHVGRRALRKRSQAISKRIRQSVCAVPLG